VGPIRALAACHAERHAVLSVLRPCVPCARHSTSWWSREGARSATAQRGSGGEGVGARASCLPCSGGGGRERRPLVLQGRGGGGGRPHAHGTVQQIKCGRAGRAGVLEPSREAPHERGREGGFPAATP
jgi:hypothetical protein